ncbi:MAG: M18 family aminopeptidase [Magnetococcales bacterium]|nr:M18 family aminopeptidase [Magnetococcales bacterium]
MIDSILAHINTSPTPYHGVQTMVSVLSAAGFEPLDETKTWQLRAGGRYYVVRNLTSLMAFRVPKEGLGGVPQLKLAGAHTDSPTLKVKPTPLKEKNRLLVWDVEIYGSPILSTWFDRDLSLAGLVVYRNGKGQIGHQLIDFKKPITRLPNLAIHLNREVNKGYAPDRHTELNPIFGPINPDLSAREQFTKRIKQALADEGVGKTDTLELLDWDLSFYDTQPVQFSGLANEWVVGARLDNLLSCFVGLESLIGPSNEENLSLLACFDHEEVGSTSTVGANGNFMESLLHRLVPHEERFRQTLATAKMISVDNAHGYHPNFPNKQDENNSPYLGEGVVLKYNTNQRYATHALSGSWFINLCQQKQIPSQHFTVRADMGCGSTIGPMLSARLGLSALDIGVPTWAMHSIRETAASQDITHLQTLWNHFYNMP